MNDKDNKLIFENYSSARKQVNEVIDPNDPTSMNFHTGMRFGRSSVTDIVNKTWKNRDDIEDLGESIEETTYEAFQRVLEKPVFNPIQAIWVKAVVNVLKYSGVELGEPEYDSNRYSYELKRAMNADQETFERAREDLYQLLYDMAAEPERPSMTTLTTKNEKK